MVVGYLEGGLEAVEIVGWGQVLDVKMMAEDVLEVRWGGLGDQ